ncbi:hypothetical protein CAPTEDRAFT_206194 [Capitella teleta]|uniref:Uncharacterized protein n=1 Tax=Capitella teleta TaxID=283909 RepID=R7UFQ9_CAPTE|nr:hypothetical protein CAPTEDRAFT_206194 [Capitella teleta]|eukprot:ELU05035.1 hypothetical protein CAPTEDRAFT_206194 [Capitella teleta]
MVDTTQTVAIVLFVVGLFLILLAVGLVFFLFRRRKRRRRAKAARQRQVVRYQQNPTTDSVTISSSAPPPYVYSLSGKSKKTFGSVRSQSVDDRVSTVPSSTTAQIRSSTLSSKFPLKLRKTERKNSKLSSRSSEKPESQRKTASISTDRTKLRSESLLRTRPQIHSNTNRVPLHSYAAPNGTLVRTGSTPDLYELRYVDPSTFHRKRHRKAKNRLAMWGLEEMPRDRRVQTWLHRQQAPYAQTNLPQYTTNTLGHINLSEVRDVSSPPSRASSAPIETSSNSTHTVDSSAVAQALYLRWSPSMKRSSFGSEGTLHTGTSFQVASESTDTRSFIIPNKQLLASMHADAALVKQQVERAVGEIATTANEAAC